MRNTFVGTIPRLLSKKSKLSKFLDQQSKVLHSLFLLNVQVTGLSKCVKTKVQTILFYLVFKNQKKVWNYPPSLIFCMAFKDK